MNKFFCELLIAIILGYLFAIMIILSNYLNIGYSFLEYVKNIFGYLILISLGFGILYLLNRRL